MSIRTAERRRCLRTPATFAAMLLNRHGRLIVHGRTTNISESGVYLLVPYRKALTEDSLIVELLVPSLSNHGRGDGLRRVRYRCQVARRERVGDMIGMGVQFLEKLV